MARLMIRMECPGELVEELVAAWLKDTPVVVAVAGERLREVRLTYVKERRD